MSVTPELSVVVCTHNPRPELFDEMLQALREQSLRSDLWELIVVDNASEPSVKREWLPNERVVCEPKLGLTFARVCGIRETRAEVIVFVDDDNILEPDYLEKALQISANWPQLGAWGGQAIPRFDTEPAEWTRKYWGLLGIRQFSVERWSNSLLSHDCVPIGAGLCVRRRVALQYIKALAESPVRALLDRKGRMLISCGDSDLALTSCDMGKGVGMFPDQKLIHVIPKYRLEEGYLLRLAESLHYSMTILDSFRNMAIGAPSRSEQLLRWYQAQRLNRRDRKFALAIQRGVKRAYQDLQRGLSCFHS